MKNSFVLFGPVHLAMLALAPLAAWLLARAVRGRERVTRQTRLGLGVLLALNELIWYGYRYSTEGNRFPEGLPLQLCDLLVWLTAAAAVSLAQWAFEFAYFAGLAGAGMAMVTPDLWAPWPSYPSIYYFVVHGLIVCTVLFLLWSRTARPRPGCLWRAFAVVNGFAAFVGAFNWIFGTNYMYLCRKPGASVLDFFGPWPVYIAAGEVLALCLFGLLWWPWRRASSIIS